MRIAVIGAGAIGGTVAALLDRAGHDVVVTARGPHLDAIRAHGLRLTGVWGEHRAPVEAAELLPPDGPPIELAVVATKAQDAAAALAANRGPLAGIPVVVVQNGLDGLRTATEAVPDSEVVGALSLIAASYLTPGEIAVTAGLPTFLGRAPGASAAPLELALRVLGGAMPVERLGDFAGAQWTKLLINHVNALPAITGLSVQDVVARPELRRILTASMRETVRLAARLGIRFTPFGGLGKAALAALRWAPPAVASIVPRLMARRMGAVPNPGSTLQSIRRGQLTEIDALNGAVVRVARDGGLDAPVNAALTELVHEVELSRVHLAPAEVADRLARVAGLGRLSRSR